MRDYKEVVEKLIEKYMFVKIEDMSYAHLVRRSDMIEVSPVTGKSSIRGSYNKHDWSLVDYNIELIPGVDEIEISGKFANELIYLVEKYLDGSLEEIDVRWFLNKFYR